MFKEYNKWTMMIYELIGKKEENNLKFNWELKIKNYNNIWMKNINQ